MKAKEKPCQCTDKCSDHKRAECGNLCQQMVGSAVDHIIEPVQVQRDRNIIQRKRLIDQKASDKKTLKRKAQK